MIGTTLSHYEITAELGRGGMGIVYKARDTKLDREVAIKVLPASALSSEDDRARFYREAKAAASLTHPNIAAVYQIDEAVPEGAPSEEVRPFIAMEFIDGETLDARIKKGPLKLKEAVRIAMQVAGALGAAHKKDVVHRDIKSANIMLTSDGEAKVLDFGLAQTSASTKLTRMGSTLGTVAYMSPEQARGDLVDGRTDLWSLGAVLYEMVAGVNPFGGDYEQAVVYSIMNEAPEPLTAVRTGVPMELERIVNKALAKETDLRYQSAADFVADLKALDLGSSGTMHSRPSMTAAHSTQMAAAPARPAGLSRVQMLGAGVAAAVLLAIGLMFGMAMGPDPVPPKVERLVLDMEGMRFVETVGLSPGGDYIAMTGYDWDGNVGLFLFDTQTGERTLIDRSEKAFYPWFSPGGDRLLYSDLEDRELYVVDVPAGSPTMVADSAYAGYWLDEDRILFMNTLRVSTSQLAILDMSTGAVTAVPETFNSGSTPQYHFPGPRVPNSRWSISNIQGSAAFGLEPRLVFVDLEEPAAIISDVGGINPQPLTDDIIIYQLGDDAGDLVARRFDAASPEFTSPPVSFRSDIFFGGFQTDPTTGSMVFAMDFGRESVKATVLDEDSGELTTFDLAGSNGQLNSSRISTDHNTLIGTVINGETGESQIVTVDLTTGSRVTRVGRGSEYGYDLLDDGRLLSLAYDVDAYPNLEEFWLVKRSLNSPVVDTLLHVSEGFFSYGGRIGNRALISITPEGGDTGKIGWLDLQSGEFSSIADGVTVDLSPDGRFVATQRGDYLLAILDLTTGNVTELPAYRGNRPRWSADGSYLYFVDFESVPEGTRRESTVSRIPVSTAGGFSVDGPKEFVLYVRDPFHFDIGDSAVMISAYGDVSSEMPARNSARIGYWRNVGHELDQMLPR